MFDVSLYKKFRRGPQVVLLKDAALVSAFTGLQSGDRVVDVGAGSGFLAVFLGCAVAPHGKVFSYEHRPDFAELAEKNVARAGLEGVVQVVRKDAFEGIAETGVDLVTLDCGDSEKLLEKALAALKPRGFIVGFLPNVEQVKAFVLEAERLGLKHEKTVEVSAREWLVREKGCRPETKGLTHTSFLCFLRKV